MLGKLRRPSPAMVVALIALFIALGGTAGAVSVAIPALAKRALNADNAKKLQNKTPTQVAQLTKNLISVETSNVVLGPGQFNVFTASCDQGKVVASGWSAVGGTVLPGGDRPVGDATWEFLLNNVIGLSAANITLYTVCLR